MKNRKRTLLVGLDAACWSYLDPLLQRERLSTIQRLINAGSSGVMLSTLPAWTPTAWASIITGKNPGKHGVYGMMWRKPGTYEFTPTNATVRSGTPFWKRLNDAGIRTGLVNVPFSHPPDAIDGFIVCGFGAPAEASDLIYPAQAARDVAQGSVPYVPAPDPKLLKAGTPEQILALEREHQSHQVELAVRLSQSHPVDVLVINLMLLDHANHYMTEMTQVEEAISQSDTDLARLINAFEPDNVMLISDHGSRRVKGSFLLYHWLLEHGYCTQRERDRKEQITALNWVLAEWLRGLNARAGVSEKVARAVLRETLARVPARFTKWIWRQVEEMLPFARRYVARSDQINYTDSRIFPESQYSGLLYFNVSDREPTGTVHMEERTVLAAELIAALSSLTDPDTGKPFLSGIYTPDQLYSGEAVGYAPDLILDGFDANWSVVSSYWELPRGVVRDGFFVEQVGDLGQHSREGIFIFAGTGFAQGESRKSWSVMDIPATLLYLHGLPIPDDYDGYVITDAIKPEILTEHPVTIGPGDHGRATNTGQKYYSPADADALINRLRALGYVA